MPSARIPNGIGTRGARSWVSTPALGAMTWLSLRRRLKYLPMRICLLSVLVNFSDSPRQVAFNIMYPENWTGHEERMLCQEEMEMRRGEMSTQRKQYSAECKARVALEALTGRNTVHA